MGNENQNVLDFLKDTGSTPTPPVNNSNNKFKNNKILIIGIIIVVIIIVIGVFISNKLSNNKKKEPINIESKIDVLEQTTNLIIDENMIFNVDTTLKVNYVNSGGLIYHISKSNDILEIQDIKMNSNDSNI
ncbi:MAG: hypothetical protein K2J20_01455, partial [Bacilli bacterium]|nr:hypothetical protein [Bacilli bacterium]